MNAPTNGVFSLLRRELGKAEDMIDGNSFVN
jgi:hypothetical protein